MLQDSCCYKMGTTTCPVRCVVIAIYIIFKKYHSAIAYEKNKTVKIKAYAKVVKVVKVVAAVVFVIR